MVCPGGGVGRGFNNIVVVSAEVDFLDDAGILGGGGGGRVSLEAGHDDDGDDGNDDVEEEEDDEDAYVSASVTMIRPNNNGQ